MKRHKYDFIIGYEHASRELNSICLLKNHLQDKGYSVLIYNIYDKRIKNSIRKYKCEVLILPAGYNDYVLKEWIGISIHFKKLVNLQWEQALIREMEEPSSYKTPKGIFAEYGYHISWGESNKKRLSSMANIDPDRIFVCGHMAMDFLRQPFRNIYLSKEQLLPQYNISPDSHVRLFVSSFKAAFSSEKVLEDECKKYGDSRRIQHDIMLKSFYETIRWFVNLAEENPDKIYIYRPHPGEYNNWSSDVKKYMDEICQNHPNFRVIEELSVQQWIIIADWICCGLSTATVDAFFSKKPYMILYPYKLPQQLEMKLFDNAIFVKSEDEFRNAVALSGHFTIPKEDIEYYYNSSKEYSSQNVASALELVLKSQSNIVPSSKIRLLKFNPVIELQENSWLEKTVRILSSYYEIEQLECLFGKVFRHSKYFRRKYVNNVAFYKSLSTDLKTSNEIEKICHTLRALHPSK